MSNPTLSDITFKNNAVTKFGGGVSVVDGSPKLSGIIFTANTAGKSGGGLYNSGARNPTLANCVFNANHATEDGGGIFNTSTNSLDFTNLTFYNNSADQNGGAFSNETTATPRLFNSILWGNTAASDPQIHYTDGAPVVSNSIVQGGHAGGTGITDSDPLFNNPATGDLTLQANSPAVNAGDNGAVSAIPWDSVDLAGNARIYHNTEGGVVDLGAYESPYSLPATVTTATAVDITATGAKLGGGITANGGGTITDYGIVWSLAQDPTTSDHKVSIGTTETSTFSKTVSGLPAGVLVHYRAYAVNEAGTVYGSDKTLSIPVAGFINALQFNGSDNRVEAPVAAGALGTGDFTITAWVKYPQTGGGTFISNRTAGSDEAPFFSLVAGRNSVTETGKLVAEVCAGPGTDKGLGTDVPGMDDNSWHHIVFERNGTLYTLYVDGENVYQETGAALNLNSGDPLVIGGRYNGTDFIEDFSGQLDEVSVWNRALSAAGRDSSRYKTFNGNEPGLLGYWKFNEIAGTTAYDNSPNGYDGVLTNMDATADGVVSTIRDFSTDEDSSYLSVLPASDAGGDALTYSLVTDGTKGTVTITNTSTGAFTYAPDADANGADSFTYKVTDDDGVISNTATVNVTINPVNDAPVVTATTGNATFAANNIVTSTPVVIDPGITVSDKDNTTLMSATISITGNHEDADSLAFTNDGSSMGSITAGAYDAANGKLILISPIATPAQWQAALRAVTYSSRSVTPGTADRTISFKVYDGTDSSVAATKAVHIIPLVLNANGILYVNNSVSGGDGSGDSWTNAIKEAGDALAVADSLKGTTPVKEIWVAKGTYKPTRIPGDGHTARDKTFVLVKDVKVYGGFAGTEASPDDRDSAKIHTDNETILSGDIGTPGDPGDNVYHVVIAASNIGTALLDGFTVTGGNADAVESFGNKVNVNGVSIYQSGGGGMALEQSGFSPTVSHVIFTGNSANADGAGMELDNNSFPTLSDIIFEENAATQYGGGLSLINSGFANISGIIFTRNTAGKSGGGLYLYSSSPSFINCVFNANHAAENGGGIFNSNGGTPTFTNFTLYNNSAVQSGGAFSNETTATPRLRNSILWGNTAATDPQIHYTGGAPVVSNSIVQGGYSGGTGITDSDPLFNDPAHDDLTLQATSPAINAGNNGNVSTTTDLAGNARIYHRDEGGVVDLGAYESPYSLPPTVTTAAAVNITATGAKLGGGITSNGGGTITDYGIVWSLAQDPTTSDHKVSVGTTENPTFAETVSGLPAGVLIHYRAYAVNEAGTAYGDDKTLGIPVAGFVDALRFDGTDDYVSIPDDPSLRPDDSITLSAWIKPETGGEAYGFVIGKEGPGSDYLLAITSDGAIHGRFHVSGGTSPEGNWPYYQTADAVIAFNQWQYVSVTYDNQTVKVYVNGILQQSFAWNWPLDLTTSGTPLTIGVRGTDKTLHFKGEIDEPQVWSKVLDANEIRAAMYKTLNGNETGLAGYWKFNEGSGATAYGNSPEGNNGTLINAPQYVASTIRDFSINEDTAYSSILAGSDASGAALSYSVVANGTKGTVSIDETTGAFTYTPNADETGSDTFVFRSADNSNTDTVHVTITAVNDAPVVTATTGSTAFTEGNNITSAPVVIDGGITLSDADNTTLTSATVSITGNFHGSEDTLLFNADAGTMGNITGSYNAAHDTLTLISPDSTATLAQWEAALQSVAYTNLSETPDTSSRIISFAVNDGSINSAPATKVVTVAAVDDAPVITSNGGADADSVSITENATTVTTVTATDPDNALTYSISGTDAGDFDIDEASGALTFNPAPDFESPADADANNIYEVTVHASDSMATDDQAITVIVTDTNDVTPVITPSQSFTVDENSADGTAVGTVAGSDGDVTPTTFGNWTIVSGNTNDAFKIDGAMGAITVNKSSQLDYETTKHYTLALTVSDGIHTSAPENVVINLNDLNDVMPVITPSQSFTVDENSADGTAVGTATVSDGDVTPATFGSWTIVSGNKDEAFKIDTTTGAITVSNGPALDFETQSSYTLTLTVSDGLHTSAPQTVAVRLNNQAEAPTGIGFVQDPLYENRPAGTLAGRFSATAQDAGATFTYTLATGAGDADNSLFTISGDALKTTVAFNYEQKNTYSIRVRSTTQYGQSLEKAFTIRISDVNEAPTLDAIAGQTICYTTAQQSVSLSGISAGEDGGQTTSLSVSSDNAALFESLVVSGNKLKYRISDAGGVTTRGTVLVTVTVTDDGGTANDGANAFSRSFTLTVNPLPVPAITSDMGTGLSKGIAAHLTATGGAAYQWAAADGILSGLQNHVLTVRPVQNTTYRVTVTSDKGCSADGEIALSVKDDYAALSANNVFTPNGDGRNDTWKIVNLDVYKNNEIFIYDRSGRLVFHKKNYQNDWNGMLNGRPLHTGTYYYIVNVESGKKIFKGFITIIRNE